MEHIIGLCITSEDWCNEIYFYAKILIKSYKGYKIKAILIFILFFQITQAENKKLVNSIYQHSSDLKKDREFNKFMHYIRYAIYRNVSYPKYTIQDKLRGQVIVYFLILKNGNVKITKLRGDKRFYDASVKAIKKTFPLNIKKIKSYFPKKVNIAINFRL